MGSLCTLREHFASRFLEIRKTPAFDTCFMHVQNVLMGNHEEWIKGIREGLTPTVAAQKAGLAHTTVLRQLSRGKLSADNVIAIAHAFNLKAGDALVQTGHIAPSDIEGAGIEHSLGLATNQQLLNEINKRVDPDSVRLFHGDGEVTPQIKSSDLDTRREAKAATPAWQERYVADSSPEELFPGDDGYGEGP